MAVIVSVACKTWVISCGDLNGKKSKNERMCSWFTFTAETNIALGSNYTPIKTNEKKEVISLLGNCGNSSRAFQDTSLKQVKGQKEHILLCKYVLFHLEQVSWKWRKWQAECSAKLLVLLLQLNSDLLSDYYYYSPIIFSN